MLRRINRSIAVRVAALLAAVLVCASPALAFRGKHIVVDRHPRGPRIGSPVGNLPPGHSRLNVGAVPYFVHGGRYYRPAGHGHGYVVVRPPVGAVLAALPLGFLTLTVGSMLYYYYGNVYYRQVPTGYMVVQAPPDVVVVHETPPTAAPDADSGDRITVTAPRLNVRSGPGTTFGIISVIDQGAVLEVRGNAPDWLYVRLPDGRHGWVQEVYTTPVIPPASG